MRETKEKILTISSNISDEYICFSIKDTGIGMTDEVFSRIFESRFSTKTLSETSGFGLGLVLTKAIIDKLGGKIEVKTEHEKGSEFTIKLPKVNT
jgi:signal transduction histidine kinase